MTSDAKPKFISFKFDIATFLALCAAMYLAYSSHQANLENTKQLSQLLTKYEQTLDAAIAGDAVSLKAYKQNVKKALNSLSEEERELMEKILSVDSKNGK